MFVVVKAFVRGRCLAWAWQLGLATVASGAAELVSWPMDAKALPQINLKLVSPKVRAERRQRHILFTGQDDVERVFL